MTEPTTGRFPASDRITISTSGPIQASIRPPGSKSLTNRAVACAALARGQSMLTGVLDSEDTRVMVDSVQRLGISVQTDWDAGQLIVDGCAGAIPATSAELFVANSGTSIRFLAALVSLAKGRYRLDGVMRMRQRPIGDLLDALNHLGSSARSESGNDCPPIVIDANGLHGGLTRVRGDISSQFLSGLLMAAPYANSTVTIEVDGALVSQPYVTMTLAVMQSFGVDVATTADLRRFEIVAPEFYHARSYDVEPDASAASYFWAAAAICGGEVTVEGLSRSALQGDVAFCDCLEKMGCSVESLPHGIKLRGGPLHGIDVNMNAISDTAQTLAVVALFANGSTTITGIAHNRHKETDRIGDLARELRRLGAEVDEYDDGLRITPVGIGGRGLKGTELQTYRDHRMAMSLALVGLRVPGVVILDPGCTEKTFPHYFEELTRVCGKSGTNVPAK